jgi:hypothetical protein
MSTLATSEDDPWALDFIMICDRRPPFTMRANYKETIPEVVDPASLVFEPLTHVILKRVALVGAYCETFSCSAGVKNVCRYHRATIVVVIATAAACMNTTTIW